MSEIEFVNREIAEAEAARAVGLLNASAESKVEAWFAMQAVADQVGPASNTGIQGISWSTIKKPSGNVYGHYQLTASCRDGRLQTAMAGPKTLVEARKPENIKKAKIVMERKIKELGGLRMRSRPDGTCHALVAAVATTEDGRLWLGRLRDPGKYLMTMVRIADAYGRDGVNPVASLRAHDHLKRFDDRASLIRNYPLTNEAFGKSLSIRAGTAVSLPLSSYKVGGTQRARLAIRAGVDRRTAGAILNALVNGTSKTRLLRAVNEGAKMAEQIEQRLAA